MIVILRKCDIARSPTSDICVSVLQTAKQLASLWHQKGSTQQSAFLIDEHAEELLLK